MDMSVDSDTALARVVRVIGAARPHHAYLFANRRANRMKVLAKACRILINRVAVLGPDTGLFGNEQGAPNSVLQHSNSNSKAMALK